MASEDGNVTRHVDGLGVARRLDHRADALALTRFRSVAHATRRDIAPNFVGTSWTDDSRRCLGLYQGPAVLDRQADQRHARPLTLSLEGRGSGIDRVRNPGRAVRTPDRRTSGPRRRSRPTRAAPPGAPAPAELAVAPPQFDPPGVVLDPASIAHAGRPSSP